MDQIIETFHLDVKLIIAQLVNFIIVFVFLYLLAAKPLTKLMHERAEKIEKGLKNAEEFDQKLEDLRAERKDVIASAKKEAKEIVAEAKALAQQEKDESLEKTRAQIEQLISKAKTEVADLKEQTVKEIKTEALELVVEVTGKVLADAVDTKVDEKIIKKHLDQVK